MTHTLLTSVAAATTHRDRDELDRAVARLFIQVLDAYSITLLRVTSDGPVKRMEHRIFVDRCGTEQSHACTEEFPAPSLRDFPTWEQWVRQSEPVCRGKASGPSYTTVFPINGDREVVGVLAIDAAAPLSTRQNDLVKGLLGILRNHLALLDYGELDTLTGLLNRKTFEDYFNKLRQQMRHWEYRNLQGHCAVGGDESSACWLALVDIDHFKTINDRFGHLFGDEILLLMSNLLRRVFRSSERLFRFGGEEFVVLLMRAGDDGAHVALSRLREVIESYAFPQVGSLTVSIGYTQISPQDVPALCIERADAALYYAKNNGRNNIRSCESLIAGGQITPTFQRNSDIDLF